MNRVLVIGGGASGMAAASKAKRMKPDLEVIVCEASRYVSYAPCGIPYYIAGIVKNENALIHYTAEFFREKRGIDVRTQCIVEDMDPKAKIAHIKENGDKSYELEFDKLVIATGASPIKPPIEGVDLDGIYTIRLIEDGLLIKEKLKKAENITIVGAGYIGLEMAEAIRHLNKKVRIIEMLDHVLPNIDKDMAEIIEKELLENNVELILGEKVEAFEGKDYVEKIITSNNEYSTDLVILAVGVRPQTDLFRDKGLEFGVKGAIKVNRRMETNLEDIYAVGDVAENIHLVTGKPTWIPLAQTANKMGRTAGTNLAGGNAEFPGVLGTAFTKVFGQNVGRTGLSEVEAQREGINFKSVKITGRTKAGYYPDAKSITVKLIYEEDSRRLLGAQIISSGDATGRTNVIATALYAKLRVDDLFFIDLGYAPPYAPVWDPLVIASSVAARKK